MSPKLTYYATPENMLARTDGSVGADFEEVEIIGTLTQFGYNDRKVYLVQTLDGARRFTTLAEHIFKKVNSIEETPSSE